MIRFYPQQLTGFDSAIQSTIRGDLPAPLTAFFTKVTHVMDTKIIVIWGGLLLAVFACKKWYSEPSFWGSNLVLTGLLVLLLKNIYQRPRPSILHLVEEKGFSFPSGHSLASTLVLGSLIIIVGQHIKTGSPAIVFRASDSGNCDHCGLPYLCRGPLILRRSRQYDFGPCCLVIWSTLVRSLAFQWRFTGKQKITN